MKPHNLISIFHDRFALMFSVAAVAAALVLGAAGCESAALKSNQALVQQQQKQIEQNQMQIQEMLAEQASGTSPGAATPIASMSSNSSAGGCDMAVMSEATRHGGDKMAAGDSTRALGYYQDALSACPGNPRAELNVARAYEALNNRAAAIQHFKAAAESTDPSESAAEQEARSALARLGAS